MDLTEQLTRRLAKYTTVDGNVALQTDGDPLLADAFKSLGWEDPHVEPPAEEPATKPAPLSTAHHTEHVEHHEHHAAEAEHKARTRR